MPFSHPYEPLALNDASENPPAAARGTRKRSFYAVLAVLIAAAIFYAGRRSALPSPRGPTRDDLACWPFIPNDFHDPPSSFDNEISAAATKYKAFLDSEFSSRSIDSLSVAVVTSKDTLLEGYWGLVRANESAATGSAPTQSSHYRVASVSKLLLTYEAWLLEQRGVISWDDPVSRHLPEFQPNNTSWSHSPGSAEPPVVTLRHLATHQSGLGHDWPAGTSSRFPLDLRGGGPPPTNGLPFPSRDDVFAAIRATPLVSPPGSTPVYSNTAYGVLGMALVAANRAHSGQEEPGTIAELMQRDVFAPLGMTGSHYLATDENRGHIVVPATGSQMIDLDFLDAMNPSGGMFTSVHDLAILARTLLDPSTGPLERVTVDRWLRPMYSFEEDDWTEMGITWEIFKHTDSYGRRRRVYAKLGELVVTHAAFALHPGSGYAIIVLMSGPYADAAGLAYAGFDIFQPAFDAVLAARSTEFYAGKWHSLPGDGRNGTGASSARISVRRGTLWIDSYVLHGKEVLVRLFGRSSLPLRGTGRLDEMRLDPGVRSQNGRKHRGCMPHWAAYDSYPMLGGASVNLIYFTGGQDAAHPRQLHVPSLQVIMRRV